MDRTPGRVAPALGTRAVASASSTAGQPGSPASTRLLLGPLDRLATYKIPARWLFTASFPLTATGKVRKDVLSAQLADMPGAAGRAASARRVPAEAVRP